MEQVSYVTKTEDERINAILSHPITVYFVLTAFCVFGSQIFPIGIPDSVLTIIRYGIPLVLSLIAFRKLNSSKKNIFLVCELLMGLCYFFSYLRGNLLSSSIVPYTVTTMTMCIPYCIFVSAMDEYETLYKQLKIGSFAISAITILYMFSLTGVRNYSMASAYQLLLCAVIHTCEFYSSTKFRWLYGAIAFVEVVMIFIWGARGPLLCFSVYIILMVFTGLKKNTKQIMGSILTVVVILIAMYNLGGILPFVGRFLGSRGLYSRTFNHLLNNTLMDDSGRMGIQDAARELINKNPIIGYGVASDVKLLGGQYVHSFPIELIFDFGYIIGGIVFIVISIKVISSLLIRDESFQKIELMLITLGYVMLFFSGTYLQSVYLFMLLGVYANNKRPQRYRIKIFGYR